jgi:hypothetical protein
VTGIVTRTELRAFSMLIGDQFEDSASGPLYPGDLMSTPADAIAFTLVEVDVTRRQLIFDLSRPVGRVWRAGRLYWQPLDYDSASPATWRTAGDRHLASSATFDCSCPDYQGRLYRDEQNPDASTGERTPLVNTGRETGTAWEQQGAGFFRQWRTLDERRDRRRNCKHVHAARWHFGVPFDEPSDYPTSGPDAWSGAGDGLGSFSATVDFESQRLLSYDRWLSSIARSIGFAMDPPGDLRDGDVPFRPSEQPVLWDDPVQPVISWCRLNDWWLQRGTEVVKSFAPREGGFRAELEGKPVLEEVDASDAGAPVIVR